MHHLLFLKNICGPNTKYEQRPFDNWLHLQHNNILVSDLLTKVFITCVPYVYNLLGEHQLIRNKIFKIYNAHIIIRSVYSMSMYMLQMHLITHSG